MIRNLWVDDERPAPDKTWNVVAMTYQAAIALLKKGSIAVISLDHDLGEGDKTGYDVVCWIEEQVFTNPSFRCPEIRCHSQNPAGRTNIIRTIQRIRQHIAHSN